jgi:Sodium/hydrogen exchanger family/Adenylate and Guanylate cyclase catalytic domain
MTSNGSGDDDGKASSQVSIYLVLFSLLLALVLVLSKLLQDCPRLSLLPEAGMILLVGMTCSVVVNWVYDGVDALDGKDDTVAVSLLSSLPQVFFLALLPPIIFNSGYHLRRELLFRHLVPIMLLAVVGTTVSAVFVAVTVSTERARTSFDRQEAGDSALKNENTNANQFLLSTKGSSKTNFSGNVFGSDPIVDTFPHTTAMFLDIAGFTKWSAERDPTQVFTLLENFYHAFDEFARKLGIFKV